MYFRPKIFEFFENINLVFKKFWPIVKQVLTIFKLLILLYFVMSVILTKKQNESSVRKYWSMIRSRLGHVRPESLVCEPVCDFPADIF